MVFIGNQPTAVPLTSDQLTDGLITSAKIADGAVVNVDVNSTAAIAYSKLNLATSIVNGDIANATIALAKLSATGTPSASTFLRGDNSWASAGATAGQVIQVVQTTKLNGFATTSGTYVDVTGLSVSITPASASNKILILAHISCSGSWLGGRLLRGSTSIIEATSDGGARIEATFGGQGGSADQTKTVPVVYLDSPSTTSSTTYKIQIITGAADNLGINQSGDNTGLGYELRTTSTITAMEIKG